MMYAAVAQMDRARASEARGREFDPPQPRHFFAVSFGMISSPTTTAVSNLCGYRVNQALALAMREGLVNKSDDDSDDSPLDEVSHCLRHSEFQPDV
jgi:hypothetical protein